MTYCGEVLGHGQTCTGDPNDMYLCDKCQLKLMLKRCIKELQAIGISCDDTCSPDNPCLLTEARKLLK